MIDTSVWEAKQNFVVLEASIAENKACLKRSPTEVWRYSRNPYDRKRQDKAPVGLKNVGNTYWFSAVIQSFGI